MTETPIQEEFPWTVTERSSGLHLSMVINDLMETLFNDGYSGSPEDEATKLQFEKGFLWEVVLSQAYAEKAAFRPPEIELDGIACSPDGLDWNGGGCSIVEEYKCTNKSSLRTPRENTRWMMQVKGYCKVTGATSCIFRILHLQGDYRGNRGVQYKVYRLDFTQEEIDENWDMIVNHAKAKGWI